MSEERVVAIVEARMGSTRLPGKSLMPLHGVPLAERVVSRVRSSKRVDDVVLATSSSAKDDPLAAHMSSAGIRVHRGSEDDVLARILGAAREERATIHVQCWGDCAFADPSEIDATVGLLLETGADVATNFLGSREVPHGLEVLAFRVSALEEADRRTRGHAYHREHATTYLYETPGAFRVVRAPTASDIAFPKLDLTINTAEDYAFAGAVHDALVPRIPEFAIRDVLALLRERPALLAGKNEHALERTPA